MPTGKEPDPTPFSRAISAVLQDALIQAEVTIRALARLDDSQSLNYYASRFRNEFSFTTTDIDFISRAAGINPYDVGRLAAEHVSVGRVSETSHAPVTQLSEKQRAAESLTTEQLEEARKAATTDDELDADEPSPGR